MKKDERIKIAKETLDIFNTKLKEENRKSYDQAIIIIEHDINLQKKYKQPASITVVNQSVIDTFIYSSYHYGILNFASAYHPGGGYLNGALAQEETLCYGSNLYNLQRKFDQEYYEYNKSKKTKCYSDRMIYTPNTIYIRNDAYQLLTQPIYADVLTSPAVNMGAALFKGEDKEKCETIMKNRMRKILNVFSKYNDRIILGAFGCGVFRNDPQLIAKYWYELLYQEEWIYCFKEIIFAVFDKTKEQNTFNQFCKILKK